MSKEKQYKVLPEFADFFSSNAKCKLLVGSPRIGKSYLLAEIALRNMFTENIRICTYFPSERAANVWFQSTFKPLLDDDWVESFCVQSWVCRFKNGSELHLMTPHTRYIGHKDVVLVDDYSMFDYKNLDCFRCDPDINSDTEVVITSRCNGVFIPDEVNKLLPLVELILERKFGSVNYRTADFLYKVCDVYESSLWSDEIIKKVIR